MELSNLQRYVLCERGDEGSIKVEIVGKKFEGDLQALPHHGTWASFLGTEGYQWERVLVALDSARDRRAVQGSLPRWIANAWTQLGDLGVSTHSFPGGKTPALRAFTCQPRHPRNQDQIIAEGLKIPLLKDQVRILLGSGQATGREISDAVAAAWGHSGWRHWTPYVDRPICELWVEGICGGGIISLEEVGLAPRELQVPLAFPNRPLPASCWPRKRCAMC